MDQKPIPMKPPQVTQFRLAEIAEIERQIAFFQDELRQKRAAIETDLRRGATVEPGPHKAYLGGLVVI
jgi:hypothetical protein